jgi:hypothetical protein
MPLPSRPQGSFKEQARRKCSLEWRRTRSSGFQHVAPWSGVASSTPWCLSFTIRQTLGTHARDHTRGTILTRASCTAFSRSASCWGSWYGMARMR